MPKASKEPKAAAKEAKPDKEKKEKKGKAPKDPNAPKKPMGAYMWFCKEKRADVVKESPDLKVTEVSKKLGELWGQVSESGKKKYQKMAEDDKARYAKDIASYEGGEQSD